MASQPLTSMEHPSKEPLFKAFSRISYKSSGASRIWKVSATPPVKSSMASIVLPPFRAS